jgi:hypothetical protein
MSAMYGTYTPTSSGESGSGGGGVFGGASAFARHVFGDSRQDTGDLFNAAQYGALAVLPVAALNRAVNWATPEPNDEASSVLLLLEVLAQVVALLVGFVLVHRAITFVPTYSGQAHDKLSISGAALAVLAILLSLKSKLGVKVSILADRAAELLGLGGGGQDARKPQQQQPRGRAPPPTATAPAAARAAAGAAPGPMPVGGSIFGN